MSDIKKLIILDRDGVINHDSAEYIKSPAEWRAIRGSLKAIVDLNALGFTVAIATNQSGVGRGLYDDDTLQRIHQKMCDRVNEAGGKIDFIAYCPHKPEDNCECRKPKTGLFEQIKRHYHLKNLKGVMAVGDSFRDLQASEKAGCTPVLVLTGNGKKTLNEHPKLKNDLHIFSSLHDFVQSIHPH